MRVTQIWNRPLPEKKQEKRKDSCADVLAAGSVFCALLLLLGLVKGKRS
mgnify:CR=1 FL=1